MFRYFNAFLACVFCVGAFSDASAQNLWQKVEARALALQPRAILPTQYTLFLLDEANFLNITNNLREKTVVIALPMPDGSMADFRLTETQMFSPELAGKMPETKTFTARGITEPTALAYLDWTMNGFHGMIFSDKGQIFIDPYTANRSAYYLTYYKHDYPKTNQNALSSCNTVESSGWKKYEQERENRLLNRPFGLKEKDGARPNGSTKRTYRAVIAATGEYTQARGGTVASAQASIVTTMNRVRGVYEKELAISFTLVDNTSIVYTNGGTDPFDNDNATTLINQSQTEIDGKIGSANYDIGHTFSTGGGGLAGLGVVCKLGEKARGITGSNTPFNDPYDIDYVAHEVGHQFGAPHTFNGNVGSCAGGNRSAGSAYEPGSGNTIMAYAGICGSNNIQSFSDPYFHTRSYDQILDYTLLGAGDGCPTKTGVSNAIPVLTMPTGGFSIPKNTSFMLTASATDADAGDVLYYCWEQMDLGGAGPPANSSSGGPSFRSFLPTTNPTRFFPRTVGNPNLSSAIGESLPASGRNFTFRCTVRDRKTETSTDAKTLDVIAGTTYGQISFSVADGAGPFVITNPSNAGIVWQGGSTQTITWNVSGTNLSPINCSQVEIMLSTDGGLTYPTTIATNTPNDGSQTIIAPNISTNSARIRIKASNNVFFDISDNNFTITATALPTFTLLASPDVQTLAPSVVYQVEIGSLNGFNSSVNLSASGNPAGTTAIFGSNNLAPNNSTTLTIGNTTGIIGQHNITITATSGAITRTAIVRLDAGNAPPTAGDGNITIDEDIAFYAFKATDFNYQSVTPMQSVRISNLNIPTGASLRSAANNIFNNQTVQLSVITSNLLRFTPAPNAFGNNYASFDFEVYDGSLYSTTKYKMTINVTSINDIPTVVKNLGIKTFPQEVGQIVISNSILEATDVEDAKPSLTFKILSLPNAGKLLLNGSAVAVNASFAQSELIAGKLFYQPNNSLNPFSDAFTFQVTDSENGSTSTQTFPIDFNNQNVPQDGEITIFPNPTDRAITLGINNASSGKFTIVISDVSGRVARVMDITKGAEPLKQEIIVSSLPAGAYFLQIETPKEKLLRKFVKINK